MTTEERTAEEPVGMAISRELERPAATVERSAIGVLRSGETHVRQAMVGAVIGSGEVSLHQGGSRAVVATGNLRIQQGGGATLLAGGDVEVTQGGTGTLVSLGDVRIRMGGALMALAGSVDVGEQSAVGIALTPRLTVHPGGRVLVGPMQAALAGVVAGVVAGGMALLARSLRRR